MHILRYFIASFIFFIIYIILTSIFHVIIFPGVWEIGLTPGDFIFSLLFVYILIKLNPDKKIIEGIKYSLLIGLLFCIPIIFGFFPFEVITNNEPEIISNAIVPGILPSLKAIYWFVLTVIKLLICGLISTMIYKPASV